MATDGTCETSASVPFSQDPVPCAPMNVTTSHSCGNNDIAVSWDTAAVPLNYSVTATLLSGSASPVQCNSDSSSCTLTGLQCGQFYNVSVKASSGSCCGPYSVPQTVKTAPCSPQGLTAVIECGSNFLQVSWNTSLSATSYTAMVTDPDGVTMNCSSSDPACAFSSLQCATQYNISVTSEDNSCSSSPSQTVITTGPCEPVNVTAVLQCGSDTATVSWEASAGAVAYTVYANEQGSVYQTFCTTDTISCVLTALNCGKMYTVNALAEGDTCNSTQSMSTTLQTAPCSPSIQNNTLVCGTSSSDLSWMSVAHATGYLVNATTQSGDIVSCSSSTAACTLTDLLCSETYMATVTAQGDQCDSAPGPSFNIITAPCPPVITSSQYICSNSSVELSWTATVGSVGFLAEVVGEGYTDSCHSVDTSCMMHNIPCGLEFNLTVQAKGSECNSTLTVSETLESVPCAPEDVDIIFACSSHSAMVTWLGSPSAVGYNVTFRSYEDGHIHYCHTNTTSCELDDIHCGEVYAVMVTPCSETCKGIPSAIYNFTGGLCPPASVSVSTDCENNTVSWSAVEGAEMFIATATAEDGHNHTCQSNYSTSCNFTDLHCGEIYSVTVVTVDRRWGCSSRPSSAVEVTTAQCPPTNLTGDIRCDTNMLTLTWDQISVPGTSYVIKAERIGSIAAPLEYSTSNTSHTLSSLQCGERYAFRVAAQNGDCLSQYSPSYEMCTAPCQPTNFNVRVNCGANNGNFSWNESSGATFYTVEVTGEHGHVASCSSNDTSCVVKLRCGRSYSASLVASTESCNSTKHADIHFESAPCLPENVVAEVNCSTNVMSVSWSELPVSDDYTAWAISEGHNASCNSTSNFCSIHDLQCGQVYDVVVTASTIHCEVIAGSDYLIQSVPCAPENTTVEQNCSTNAITVQWDHSSSGQQYTVSASSASGVNATCDTTNSSCSFLDLSCGQHYTFTVTGHTNVCMSESTTMEKYTAPCPPSNVSAELNCVTHDGVVSWSPAAASVAYSVQAMSVNGHNSSCSSMGTSCNLEDLVCGQEYSVVVEPMHTGCSGPVSPTVMLLTEPCVPMNLSVNYSMSHAMVQWDPASSDSSYSIQAVTDQGPTVSCNSTTTSCPLTGLQCSKTYNITVTAHNSACSQGVTSEAYQLMTEPCPPTNVQATMTCEQYTATVSWDPSVNAVNYVAYVDNQNGHYTSCDTTSTSCVVEALVCGTEYNVWGQAFGVHYHSENSTAITLSPGPCHPTSIDAIMDCESDTAIVSWQPSDGAGSYTAELTASSGHTTSCTTNHTNCQSDQLQCGQQYNVTVTAVAPLAYQPLSCNATAQMSGYLTTEPCVPMNLAVQYNVSDARVTWDAANGATSYLVQAVTDEGLRASCNSTYTLCYLNGLLCSQTYNVTVMAHNSACNHSEPSEMYLLMTEPCPPTNIQANVECEQLTVTVSWEQSDNAIGYVAYINNQNGHSAFCVAAQTETYCDVSGLVCGTEYNAWVKATGAPHNSSDSEVISFTSAPCLPTEIDVEVDCAFDGAALISWSATESNEKFAITAIVSGSLQTLCTTRQNNCSVNGLNCGETYNLSLTASNTQCSLAAPMHANLTTRPCPPEHVSVDLECGVRMAVLSWEERSDVELYKASAVKQSGGEVMRINSTSSTADFPDLDCGETYNFTVEAHSQGCCSRSSSTVSIQTEPCQPMNISVQAPCQSETVEITWQQASGVENYLVTASGNLGYVENFNVTQTVLSAALPCGQNYTVTIQGRGNRCDSIPSSPTSFKTTPCIPQDVVVYPQCEVNTGSVRWGASDGAKTYIAIATGHDGHNHTCVTNTTSCTWDDLHCGECYDVTVKAKDGDCMSLPSNSSVIHMASCVPQNLVASVDCDNRLISLSWDATEYTEEYIITVQTSDGTNEVTTNNTDISFSDFACGRNYSLTVTPENQHCPRSANATTSIQTWPCPLTGVSAMLDCLSDTTTVTWQSSNGAESYKATLQTDNGISEMCMSESTTCSVSGLACGYNFSVSVTASNQQCNVTTNEATSLQSAPCVPTDVSVMMDCANNSAAVSWAASRGAVQYEVIAHSSHGNVTCQTSDLSCYLRNLTCGHSYTVQVVAMDDTCSSTPSQAVELNSAPCPPENVTAQLSCSSSDMTVSWDPTGEADHYLVSVTPDNGGSVMPCNTTNTECSFSNLACGNTYTVHVTSVRGSCHSQHCPPVHVLSAPCQPQGVEGSIDCVTNSAWISWDAAAGADSYTVLAVGEGDYMANCTTSTNITCEVEDLECGIRYNFTVTATNSQCDSQPSATIELETAPCTLSRITASPQCHNASILVVWHLMDAGSADVMYTATAEGSDRTILSCNSTGTSCYLHGAQCGLHYTVIVAANSDVCSDLRSPPHRISMEPCQPTNLMVNYSCDDHTTVASWSPSPVAETYHLVARGADGHNHTCDTSFSNCSLSQLHCDMHYSVFVTASHENCSSQPSETFTLLTGPCQPEGLSVEYQCNNQSAMLSWTPSDNAVDYYGCAQDGNGNMLYCHSTTAACTIQGLECGTVYNFSVQASDGSCNSSFSDPEESGAVPCSPDGVEVTLFPLEEDVHIVHVTWTESSCNNTEYMLMLTGNLLGDNQAQFDLSSYWTSMTFFEFPLPCGSYYEATVESRNNAGTSGPSVPLNGTTVPCPPSTVTYSGNSSFTRISWNDVVFATSYTVYDNSSSPRTQLCHTSQLTCSVHQSTTPANVVVTARNAAGESRAMGVTNVVPLARRRRDVSEQEGSEGLSAPILKVTPYGTVLFLEWSKVNGASFYNLVVKKQDSISEPEVLTVNGEQMILNEEDLQLNINYCITVSASASETSDPGPESSPVCAKITPSEENTL
ncbi:uncharacterized protein LOC115437357 [Sphaeramia orbicularis]|uniref:uncharacterized protein LOC115437357 n=1 Tax=Sphaeramia orbicularis TaxID=375764 RepID=UPI00117FC2F5|nr:uncharacterized protein LOC115437357 [Sphaeramia orbicularis]